MANGPVKRYDYPCPLDDRKQRVRKMIEVTSSTRYMTFVEGDGASVVPIHIPTNTQQVANQHFSTSITVVDSSLGNLTNSIGDDKYRFGGMCRKVAQQYTERLQEIEAKMEECSKMGEKYQKLENQVQAGKLNLIKKLQGVLKVNQKKREKREKLLVSLMQKMK